MTKGKKNLILKPLHADAADVRQRDKKMRSDMRARLSSPLINNALEKFTPKHHRNTAPRSHIIHINRTSRLRLRVLECHSPALQAKEDVDE